MLPHARNGNNNIKSCYTRINVQLWDIMNDHMWDRVSNWDRVSYHALYHEVKYWSCVLKLFRQLTYLLQWSSKIRDPMMAMLHQRITVHETHNSNHHQKSQSDWQTRQRDTIFCDLWTNLHNASLKDHNWINPMISTRVAYLATKPIVFDCR